MRVKGRTIADYVNLPISEAMRVVDALALIGPRSAHRGAHPAGDTGSPAIPERRRRRLPDAGAQRRDAVGRRRAAHPPRDADRRQPDGRALRPRRAVDRPAPARQPQAARRRWPACAISATPSSSSNTTRRRFGPPTTSSTLVRAPASTAATSSSRARRDELMERADIADGCLSVGDPAHRDADVARVRELRGRARDPWGARQQPQEHRRRNSARAC